MTDPTTRRTEGPGSRLWSFVGVLGEILITLGLVLLLMVAYQLWWTNVQAGRATSQTSDVLTGAWADRIKETVAQPEPETGEAFAKMYIPRLRDKVWGIPVVQGVEAEQLSKGVGHYEDTAMPGEIGNFATAAHRATNGEPFRNIDQIRADDKVYVETRDDWFVYVLEEDQIVTPEDVWVIDPVPGEPDQEPTERLITLTTCHPRWASYERWIWWGTLEERIDKESGRTPKEIEAAD